MSRSIVRFAIYPAIGVARVGNSPTDYFFGPEMTGRHPDDDTNFRDKVGRLKRQAARFRVYGLDERGEVVREITGAEAEITWQVHIANKKAAWYQFDQAFDIPASKGLVPGRPQVFSGRRNSSIDGVARNGLTIDPGSRSIGGELVNRDGLDSRYAFATGTFLGTPVYLGELRTDEAGRLVILGGRGHSFSPSDMALQQFCEQ